MSNRFIIAAFFSLFGFFGVAQAQLPEPFALPSLDLRAPAPGRVAINTPDGGAIISGDFRWIGGDTERLGIVKLLPDGSVDPSWQVTAQGVSSLAVSGDRLYIGGSFGIINGTARRGLAQVSLSTGALSAWDPNSGSSSNFQFRSMVITGTQIIVGGDFSQVGTTTRTDLAKIDSISGVLDSGWTTGTNDGAVNVLAADATHVYAVGGFTQINGLVRNRAAKIELATGNLDATWQPSFSSDVLVMALEGSDLYAGGCFASVNGTQRNFFAKVSTQGAGGLNGWNPTVNGGCNYGIALTPTHVYLAGIFSTVGGQAALRLARVDKSVGTLDSAFQPNPSGGNFNYSVLARANGKLLALGEFTRIGGGYSPGLAELDANGALSGNNLGAEQRGIINALAPATDGGTWVGGYFSRIGPDQRSSLLKLSNSGALDNSVTINVNGQVNTLAVADNQVYVGGIFNMVGNFSRANLARLSAAGAVDSAWNANTNNQVLTLKVGGGDDLYVGGSFSNIGGQARNQVAKLSQATAAISAWNPVIVGNNVRAIEVDSSSIYLGGQFSSVGGQVRANLAKVDLATGALNSAFAGNANSDVYALLLGPNSTLYTGGGFSIINGLNQRFARLLISTGAPDPTWNINLSGGLVSALSNGTNGIYVGGSYSSIAGLARTNIARISHSGVVAPLFAPNAFNDFVRTALEHAGKVYVGGQLNIPAPTSTRQIGLMAFPIDATPVNTTTTITLDAPENSSPFQAYQVSVNVVGTGGIIPVNQLVVIEDDLGATCSAFLDGAGNGSCEIASRQAGTRTLSARFSGTPLLLASSDTEPHTVVGTSVTPPVNTAFALRTPAFVSASVRLSDGSVVIGGNFTRIGDTIRRGLAKLLPDGTLDPSFSADVIGNVNGLTRDTSDNIFVVGSFGYIDGVLKRNVAKLNASGDVISTWSTGETCVGTSAEILVDAAGNLVLPGCTRFISGTPNTYEARLLKLSGSSGALMPDFSSVLIKTNSTAIFPNISLLQDASGLYLYGRFETVNGTARSNIAKIDAVGALTSWNPGTNNFIRKIIADGNGGLYIGGDFSQVAGQPRSFLAQLDATGTLVNAFTPASDSTVQNILLSNNQLYVTGFFSQIGGGARFSTAKLDPVTGAADAGFVGAPYSAVRLERLGTQLWGASNTFVFGATEITSLGAFRQDINNGAVLPTPSVTRQAQVRALARQPDGATLVGGFFVRPGSLQSNIARISATGQLDTSFTPRVSSVNAIKVRDNGDIYVTESIRVTKINAAGVIDTGFNSALNSTALSLQLVTDGVIVGGFFSTASTLPRAGLAKLDYATGLANASWNPTLSANGVVRTIAEDSTGNLYFGGNFTTVGGIARLNFAKTNAAGVPISFWQADANSTVSALMVDGTSIYAGGSFSSLGGTTRNGIGKLSDSSGIVNSTWNPAGNRFVNTLALARAQDGGILVGGSFLNVGGAYRSNAAKLDPTTGNADATWNPSFDSTVRAILAGYGGTPARVYQPAVEQNIAIGGDFEFAGSTEMPGFTAVSSVGAGAERVFCSGFEDADCRPLP